MRSGFRLIKIICLAAGLGLLWSPALAAQDEVAFSGVVKKVIVEKNKVAIKDPVTKKRFTVVVDEKTQWVGFKSIKEVNKKDKIEGTYIVTKDGRYVATKLVRK